MTNIFLYASSIFASTLLSALLLLLLAKHRANPAARALAGVALCSFGVCLSFLLAMFSPDEPSAVFWHANVRLVFNSLVVSAGYYFIYIFLGGRRYRRAALLAFSVPLLTGLFSLTNARHGLLFQAYEMYFADYYLRHSWRPGGWFTLQYVLLCFLFVGALYHLLAWMRRSAHLPRTRGFLLVGAVLAIFVSLQLDTLGLTIAPGVLSLPVVLGLAALALTVGIWYLDLFDPLPVARRALIRYLPEGVLVLDPANKILDANPAAAQLVGLAPADVIGQNVLRYLEPLYTPAEVHQLLNVTLKTIMRFPVEGRERLLNITVTPIEVERGVVDARLVVVQDITELRQLQIQDQQRIALEERQRIARDLHDAVSQALFSARLTLEMLLHQKDSLSTQAVWDNITLSAALVKSALGEMRILLLELRPEGLEQAELPTLLGHLVDGVSARTEAEIELYACECSDVPPQVKVAFYRIAQEALHNAIKHANCTCIDLFLTQRAGELSLVVEDNGVGLKPDLTRPGKRPGLRTSSTPLGLRIMHERASGIGARLEISSPSIPEQPGMGTRVTCTWRK